MTEIKLICSDEIVYRIENGQLIIQLPASYEIHFGPGPGGEINYGKV